MPEVTEVQIGEPNLSKKHGLDQQTVNELIEHDVYFVDNPVERNMLQQGYQDMALFVQNRDERRGFLPMFKKRQGIPGLYQDESGKWKFFAESWENFANNQRVQEALGKDRLLQTEEKLSRNILNISLESSTLEKLKNPLVAHFVILNKYNPLNMHGQKDFGFKEVQKYLSKLSPEKTVELKNSPIQGIKELAELFEKNPEPTQENLSNFRQQIITIALHLLRNGTHAEQLYIVTSIARKILAPDTTASILSVLEDNRVPENIRIEFFKSNLSKTNDLKIGNENDYLVINMLFGHLQNNPNETLLNLLKDYEGELLDTFIKKQEISSQDISNLSKVLGIKEEEIRNAIGFVQKQKQLNPDLSFSRDEYSTKGVFAKLIALSTNKDISPLLERLYVYGFSFNSYQSLNPLLFSRLLQQQDSLLPLIEQLSKYGYKFSTIDELSKIENLFKNPNKDQILLALAEIKKYDPDFSYSIVYNDEKYFNPYLQFARQLNAGDRLDYKKLLAIKEDKGIIPLDYSTPLQEIITAGLGFERFSQHAGKPNSKLLLQDFNNSLNLVLEDIKSAENLNWYYADNSFLYALALFPGKAKELATLPSRFPELIDLMQEGGPLYTNRQKILFDILSKEDIDKNVIEIIGIFTTKQPYWEQVYFYTQKKLGDILVNADTEYPVRNSSGKTKPFVSLPREEKFLVFKEYLRKVVEASRDEKSKQQANRKNRDILEQNLVLSNGDYIHGAAYDYLDKIFLNGNLCGEALGEFASADQYPFHVDFSRVFDASKSTQDVIENSMSMLQGFGEGGKLGKSGQMFHILKRNRSDYEKGIDYQIRGQHYAIFTGVPSTAIDAFVLRDPSAILESVAHEIVENGFYIPVYDLKGSLIFSPQDYDQLRQIENIENSPVETWDYSLKTGSQKGSNPAAEFTVPQEDGPTQYYVKFKTLENDDQIWNELLADSIYRTLGISVPDTKAVRVNGTYGHASKLIPDAREGTGQSQDWKKGYLADCLLSNWDILSVLEQNTVSTDQTGDVFRVDNGGALLYRARGERKEKNDFGETVNELNENGVVSPQKMGISAEELKTQSQILKERLTDETIDKLVDSVRLKIEDREYLKKILKSRRNHILSKFLQ